MKRIDWIILSIVLVAIAGTLIWYFFVYRKPSAEKIPAGPSSQLPTTPISYNSTPSLVPASVKQMPRGEFPLKQGDRNRRVYQLQVAINSIKGTSMSEDGVFGNQTLMMLKQQYSGITQVSQEFAALLLKAVESKAVIDQSARIALQKIQATY